MRPGDTRGKLTYVAPRQRYAGKSRGLFLCACGRRVVLPLLAVKEGGVSCCGCTPREKKPPKTYQPFRVLRPGNY